MLYPYMLLLFWLRPLGRPKISVAKFFFFFPLKIRVYLCSSVVTILFVSFLPRQCVGTAGGRWHGGRYLLFKNIILLILPRYAKAFRSGELSCLNFF